MHVITTIQGDFRAFGRTGHAILQLEERPPANQKPEGVFYP